MGNQQDGDTMFRSILAPALGALAIATFGTAAMAQDLKPVSFSLDWALQGNHAIWALALANGDFTDEGLNVTMDRGYGSGDTIVKVAAGAYDIGFTDVNALVKFNAENPDQRLIAFYQVFDRTPNSIITLKSSGIAAPADLAGRTIGAPEADSSRIMFGTFAAANAIDPASINWVTMAPNLRETMLIQGQVEAISGFSSTSVFNLITAGVPEDDITVLAYADHGLDLYGSVLVAREDYLKANPEVISGFVKATVDGSIGLFQDPEKGLAAVKAIEPLFDVAIEGRRLQYLIDRNVLLSPAFKEHGLGYVDPERMATTIATNATVYGFEPLAPELVYTTEFLPPAAERMPPK